MIPAKLQEQLDELAFFSDRQERIEALIALADEYKHPSEEDFPRDPGAKVPGCESEVFVSYSPSALSFAIDNPQGISAMAMSTILVAGLEGASAEDIQKVPEEIVFQIFGNELSMGKNLGLTNMIRVVKHLAERGTA